MPRSSGQKLKLLYLMDYLLQSSDAEHPVTVKQLIAHLAAHDISAERKSIYEDWIMVKFALYDADIECSKRVKKMEKKK